MKRFIALVMSIILALSASACGNYGLEQEKAADYSEIYAAVKANYNGSYYGYDSDGMVFVIDDTAAESETGSVQSNAAYSETNVQVDGIDESCPVKTDGKSIFALDGDTVSIYSAAGADSSLIGSIELGENHYCSTMYLSGSTLILVGIESIVEDSAVAAVKTSAYFYDVSDPTAPVLIKCSGQDGNLVSSRLYDGKLYLITNYWICGEPEETEPETYVPRFYCDGEAEAAAANCIAIAPEVSGASYVVAGAYYAASGEAAAQLSVLGAGSTLYMNADSLYLSAERWVEEQTNERQESVYTVTDVSSHCVTDIIKISVSELAVTATGSVPGSLSSQFAMDEYEGVLRIVTTDSKSSGSYYVDEAREISSYKADADSSKTVNALYILDGELKELGSIENLAEGETVYSVRFDGDYAYFCTFRQVDPLFAADVSDPAAPQILSELKISGFSDYLHDWSDTRLFGLGMEADEDSGQSSGMKLVMFDTSDKADVTVKAALQLGSVDYSPALYDHTALLIDPDMALIGFASDSDYYLFSYNDDEGFVELGSTSLSAEIAADCAGYAVYADNAVYVMNGGGMSVLSLEDFTALASVSAA